MRLHRSRAKHRGQRRLIKASTVSDTSFSEIIDAARDVAKRFGRKADDELNPADLAISLDKEHQEAYERFRPG